MCKQHLVEILAPHLKGMRRAFAQGAREVVGVVAACIIRFKIRARLVYRHGTNFFQHPQALEYRQIHRQQRFTDVEARMPGFFELHHAVTALRQERRGGAAARAAADHQDIAVLHARFHVTHTRAPATIIHKAICAIRGLVQRGL